MIDPSQLTVVIPTFNRLPLLQQSIQSLKDQTIQGFNVLILDNNSNDGTSNFIQNLSDCSFQIELIQRDENIGYFQNLASGINLVNTKYIAFLSDDNLYLPQCLETLLSEISENDDIRIVIGSHNLVNFQGKLLKLKSKMNNLKYGRSSKLFSNLENEHVRALQIRKKLICIDSSIFLTDQLQNAAKIEKHTLDYTLFAQYLILGGNAKYISDSIMNYRQNPQGISQNLAGQVAFAKYVIKACNELLICNQLTQRERVWIKNEIIRYQYVLVKQDLIDPRFILNNFRWNSNFESYKILTRLPIFWLLNRIKHI